VSCGLLTRWSRESSCSAMGRLSARAGAGCVGGVHTFGRRAGSNKRGMPRRQTDRTT
jgi:hypothetical protein